jgi:ankyrin repeat protein
MVVVLKYDNTTTNTDAHLAKKSNDSFACFAAVCGHTHLNPDKDVWKDGKTALQRAAENLDARACFALLERKASVSAKNHRDGNKTAVEYAERAAPIAKTNEALENKERVVKLLQAERDGTEEGLERFKKKLNL